MAKMLHTVLVLGLAAAAFASPLRVQHEEEEWLHSGKFEGDMVLNPDQLSNLQSRNGIIGDTYRWPDRTIVYELSSDFNAAQRDAILAAFQQYQSRTCIQFRERVASDPDYVYVTGADTGCWSYVGRNGGRQQLNLALNTPGAGCFRNGTIIHEFLHALGFYHQQSATERDDYVTIVWENIQAGYEHNFDKYPASEITSFGVTYDYGSVMHYPAVSFSINGEPTIVPTDPNAQIGQRLDFSNSDIQKLQLMYGCA